MERIKHGWHRTPKRIRQLVVLIIGAVVILAGLIMLVTPGPGWLAIFIGLAILATEFEVADRWKKNVEKRAKQAGDMAKRLRKK